MPKILIADDSRTARMIVRRCLEMAGFQGASFVEAADGADALLLAGREAPDLIVADLNMPKLDGESLLKTLKEGAATRPIPVVIASSAINAVRSARLTELGAHGIVQKPVSPAALSQALGDWKGA
jgi:two-component system, chemotaxis family, chemotaxis protein CheY